MGIFLTWLFEIALLHFCDEKKMLLQQLSTEFLKRMHLKVVNHNVDISSNDLNFLPIFLFQSISFILWVIPFNRFGQVFNICIFPLTFMSENNKKSMAPREKFESTPLLSVRLQHSTGYHLTIQGLTKNVSSFIKMILSN